jgi:flagellar biosynthesis/type III secretory pathway ATPase
MDWNVDAYCGERGREVMETILSTESSELAVQVSVTAITMFSARGKMVLVKSVGIGNG